ncbi:lytic transglycosylase domain-containing protein [Candidatus Woesearchaeota archaeon]|nr:lytic transglycosylase domain-containing protein [Candidatus Woesearchaeota archaeon]
MSSWKRALLSIGLLGTLNTPSTEPPQHTTREERAALITQEQLAEQRSHIKDLLIYAIPRLDTLKGGYLRAADGKPDIEYNRFHARRKTGQEIYRDRQRYGEKGLAWLLGTTSGTGGDEQTLERFLQTHKHDILEANNRYPRVKPETLAAIFSVEAGGHEWAVSATGALGPAQLTKYIYLDHPYNNEDTTIWKAINPFDSRQALDRMAQHLDQLYTTTRQERDVLAKYNQGPRYANAAGQAYADTVLARRDRFRKYFDNKTQSL